MHLGRVPRLAGPCRVSLLIQLECDFPEGRTVGTKRLHQGQEIVIGGLGHLSIDFDGSALALSGCLRADRPTPRGVATEFSAACDVRLQSVTCSLADPVGFIFGDGSENVDRQLVCMRVVARQELHAGFHQRRDERHVPGQSIQLRNYKRCPRTASVSQRFQQFRPTRLAAAFNLRVFAENCPGTALGE